MATLSAQIQALAGTNITETELDQWCNDGVRELVNIFPQNLKEMCYGKNTFTFTAGLFRLICENGLVIADEKFEDVKMRHMGYSFEDLQDMIKDMVEKLPLTVESMNKMKAVELEQAAVLDFAKKALNCRFTDQEMNRISIDLDSFITPVRKEDSGKDLWSVFNVVQEKLFEGDFDYCSAGKARKAREIKNFKQDMKINKGLYELALEYC